MSEEESHLGQQDPYPGIRQRFKNFFNPPAQGPDDSSKREFLKQGAAALAGAALTATAGGKILEGLASQQEDKFIPNYDRFEEVAQNLEVRNFSSVNVALSRTEIANFMAKYGQLQNKVSILFYDSKLPDKLPEGEIYKCNLYGAQMPGNVGNLEAFQRTTSAKVASQLYEAIQNGKFQENPIAENDFQTKIEKGLLPPLVHLSN